MQKKWSSYLNAGQSYTDFHKTIMEYLKFPIRTKKKSGNAFPLIFLNYLQLNKCVAIHSKAQLILFWTQKISGRNQLTI